MRDLQEVGCKFTGHECVHHGLQEFEVISRFRTREKQNAYPCFTAGRGRTSKS